MNEHIANLRLRCSVLLARLERQIESHYTRGNDGDIVSISLARDWTFRLKQQLDDLQTVVTSSSSSDVDLYLDLLLEINRLRAFCDRMMSGY